MSTTHTLTTTHPPTDSPQFHLFTPPHNNSHNNSTSALAVANSPALTALAQIVTDSNNTNTTPNTQNQSANDTDERTTGISILRLTSPTNEHSKDSNDTQHTNNNGTGGTKRNLNEHHDPATALLDIMSSPTASPMTNTLNTRRSSNGHSYKKLKLNGTTYTPEMNTKLTAPDMSPLQMSQTAARSPPSNNLNHTYNAVQTTPIQQQVITTSSGRKSIKPLPSHATTMLSNIQSLHSTEPGGSSCHQCKSRRAYTDLTYCTSSLNKKTNKANVCRKKYCDHCLKKFYRELPVPQNSNQTWACPSCRKICCCAACRRREVRDPADDTVNNEYYNNTTPQRYNTSSPTVYSNSLPPMHSNGRTGINGTNGVNGLPSTMISMLHHSIDKNEHDDSQEHIDDSDSDEHSDTYNKSFPQLANTFAWFYSVSQIPHVNTHIHSILNQTDITNEHKVKLVENVLCEYVTDVASNKTNISTADDKSINVKHEHEPIHTAHNNTSKPPPLIDPSVKQ